MIGCLYEPFGLGSALLKALSGQALRERPNRPFFWARPSSAQGRHASELAGDAASLLEHAPFIPLTAHFLLFISPHRSLLSSSLSVGGSICGGSSSTAASIFDTRRRAANSPLFRAEELHPHVGSTASSHLLLKDFVNGGKSIASRCMARNRPRSVDPLLFVCLH